MGGCKEREVWQLPSLVSGEGVNSLCSAERSLTALLTCRLLLVLTADTALLTYRSAVILLARGS